MNELVVKSRETITDQYDLVRIVENKEYEIIHEFDDTYLIIDEGNKEVNLSKEYFYELEEDIQ